MTQCCAPNCKNQGRHIFPKDPKRRKAWEKALTSKNFKATEHSKLCSAHFKADDYFGQSKYTVYEPKAKFLKKIAVPSIFSFTKTKVESTFAKRRLERLVKWSQRKLMLDVPIHPQESNETCLSSFSMEIDSCNEVEIRTESEEILPLPAECVNTSSTITQSLVSPALGRLNICFACGMSIASRRTHRVTQDCPQRNVLLRRTPAHHVLHLERVCRDCWEAASREILSQAVGGVNRPTLESEIAGVAESCADAGGSGPVEEPMVCRVCLALDVKMYDLKDIELREMFQDITGIAVTENNHSILERLCWECAGRLKAAAAFRKKALLSDALLQRLANTGEQIRKNDITLIKEKEDYLKSAATLSIVKVFHTVEIDPENECLPSIPENNDAKVIQNTRKDSEELEESIIEENNDEMDVEDESMIEAPIKTEIEYDSLCLKTNEVNRNIVLETKDESIIQAPIKTEIEYDFICPNTGEENRNIVSERNPLFSNNTSLREDTIKSAYSSPPPSCSHIEPKYPILGYLLKTPSDCEDKIKKTVVKIKNKDSISKIVSKNSTEVISHDHTYLKSDAKFKNINVKVGDISKKT